MNVLISIANDIAKREGLTEEIAIINRVSEICQDAQKETPETDTGKEALLKLKEILAVQATNGGTPSPYMAKPSFDYEKLRDETSLPACVDILKLIGENSEYLPVPQKMPSEEYQLKSEEAYDKLILDTFKILNDRKVGLSEYTWVFQTLKSVVSFLELGLEAEIRGHRQEILSRICGTRNPDIEKNGYDIKFATYADLANALIKVREQTGNNAADYFNVTKQDKSL